MWDLGPLDLLLSEPVFLEIIQEEVLRVRPQKEDDVLVVLVTVLFKYASTCHIAVGQVNRCISVTWQANISLTVLALAEGVFTLGILHILVECIMLFRLNYLRVLVPLLLLRFNLSCCIRPSAGSLQFLLE